jgi:hypothetical protein
MGVSVQFNDALLACHSLLLSFRRRQNAVRPLEHDRRYTRLVLALTLQSLANKASLEAGCSTAKGTRATSSAFPFLVRQVGTADPSKAAVEVKRPTRQDRAATPLLNTAKEATDPTSTASTLTKAKRAMAMFNWNVSLDKTFTKLTKAPLVAVPANSGAKSRYQMAKGFTFQLRM